MNVFVKVVTAVCLFFCGSAGVMQGIVPRDAGIRIERLAPETVMYRTVRGDYGQHPKVIAETLGYATRRYPGAASMQLLGIYPVDPDTVASSADLVWEIGVILPSGKPAAPEAPYKIKTLAATEACVLDSDVAHTALDGLAMSRWLLENGYVQIAPTRMAYSGGGGDPQDVRTRIIIPVLKRPSGLKLPPR